MPDRLEPAWRWCPDYQLTYGPVVSDLAALAGFAPDPEQEAALDEIFAIDPHGLDRLGNPRSLCFEYGLVAPRQNIKALAVDTPLLTDHGWTTMGDIRVGWSVYGPDGEPAAVTAKSTVKYEHDVYRVETTDGRVLLADADHVWTVLDRRRGKAGEWCTKTTVEMLSDGLERTPGGREVHTSGVAYVTREFRFQLPQQSAPQTPVAELPIDPYVFGSWLGDGKSTGNELFCAESDVSHWVFEFSQAGYDPRPRRARTCWSIGIARGTNVPLGTELRRLGVFGDKRVPDVYLSASAEQREALLQGLMDTDGTINRSSGQTIFVSTKQALAEAVAYLVRSLGWRASVRPGVATLDGRTIGPKWTVSWTPKRDDPYCPFRMKRKCELVHAGTHRNGWATVSIRSITAAPSVPVQCIKVDRKDGLYLAGRDLVVTHNTGLAKQCELGWLFITDQRLVIHSAHEVPTTTEAFNDMVALITNTPELSKRLPSRAPFGMYRTPGRERITLANGQRLQFRARTKSGGRGLTGNKIVLDEAFALDAAQMGALMPTLAVVADPQILYLSSAGLVESEQLRTIRDRGRSGNQPRMGYREFGSIRGKCRDKRCTHGKPGTPEWRPGCQLDDPDLLLSVNSQLGKRFQWDTMLGLRAAMPPAEFAREFLSWWDEPGVDAVFGTGAWANARTHYPDPMDFKPLMIGAAVAMGQAAAALVACGLRKIDTPDGVQAVPAVKVLTYGPGEAWLVDSAKHYSDLLKCPVVMAKDGPGSHLIEPMQKRLRGSRFRPATFAQYMDACADTFVAVSSGAFQHGDQEELNDAVDGAEKVDKGDRWVWRRRGAVDICPLEAMTLAVWGVKHGRPQSAADQRMAAGGSAVDSV